MKTATQKYIEENQRVFSLPRKKSNSKISEKSVSWSILGLIIFHLKSLLRLLIRYPIELYRGRYYLKKTLNLKNIEKNKKALVIGNGPSQGKLKVEMLDHFQKNGGLTICVNYWNENSELTAHIPSWIVFSDPNTFNNKSDEAYRLIEYLKKNTSIKITAPISIINDLSTMNFKNELYCFIDTEVTISKNINPLFPRGYLSMTLYKALAWSLHLGFEEIGVIGMDNTYPRNIYNDENNKLCNLETHSGIDDFIVDQSEIYPNIAVRLEGLARLFLHLDRFPQSRVSNLDRYSLTDRFNKKSIEDFFNC
jgi:hypothetical protein